MFGKLFKKRLANKLSAATTADAAVAFPPDELKILEQFQKKFSIRFSDPSLVITALKHRSYLNLSNEPRTQSNERLEFLGDAVLDLVVTEFLYSAFPNRTEGQLSKMKSILVSKPVLADAATRISLGSLLLMNKGEEKTGGRSRHSILADALEAVIGAIFLDAGFEEARRWIMSHVVKDHKRIIHKGVYRNYKSILLEYAQAAGGPLPDYRVVKEIGPDHAKEFVIEVSIGEELLGVGSGNSKKVAEQEAAREAVKKLDLDEVQ